MPWIVKRTGEFRRLTYGDNFTLNGKVLSYDYPVQSDEKFHILSISPVPTREELRAQVYAKYRNEPNALFPLKEAIVLGIDNTYDLLFGLQVEEDRHV